jgi:hypothetical protein
MSEDSIKAAFENAEPPPRTIEWAGWQLQRFETDIIVDITAVYNPLYLEAAAILYIDDPGWFARLRTRLKTRGVRISDWTRRVEERARVIKHERAAAAQQAQARQHQRNQCGQARARR